MVGNRPVVGVRNPVRFTSTSSLLRAKTPVPIRPSSAVNHILVAHILILTTSEPGPKLLEAAPQF